MPKCPFLSTDDNKVGCFKECLLHQYENDDGECPFRAVLQDSEYDRNLFNIYKDIKDESSSSVLEEIYKENNFLEIFQI